MRKLNKQELRVGNFISAWRIDGSWETKQIQSGTEIDFIIKQQSNNIYKPVVLTQEWVERFAYDFKKKGWPDLAVSCSVKIDDETPVDVHFVVNKHYTKLDYVHQLQNMYYDHVGEDLKDKEVCHEH